MSERDKTFTFHVGAHTTGSRLIQKCLRDHTDALAAAGVRYLPRATASRLVDWGDRLVENRQPFAAAVDDALRQPRFATFLTSHENTIGHPIAADGASGLYPHAAPALQALAELSRPYRQVIVLSVRPQAEFLEAYYLHTLATGNTATFDTWLQTIDLDQLSWLPLHEQLVATFGADAVRVLDYRRSEQGLGAFLAEFFRLVGIASPARLDDNSPVEGAVLSDQAVRLSLAANRYLSSVDERRRMRAFLQAHFCGEHRKQPTLLSPEQKAGLHARYDGEYAHLVAADGTGNVAGDVTRVGGPVGQGTAR